MKRLGLGIQELSVLRDNNCVYVDKTEIIYKLIDSSKYNFLSRPRRFGKSLLVNTMDELFSGNKELFKDTWIYNRWNFDNKSPVIKIGIASLDYKSLGLEKALNGYIDSYSKENGIILSKVGYAEKFKELIHTLGKDTPVVILVDEYDKPIIDYITDLKKSEENREVLKSFYSVVKDCDKYIKLLFITGVSKFSKVSFFSELNNLRDITLSDEYSKIAGYSEDEIKENYGAYLLQLEDKYKIKKEALLNTLRLWYNGYSWDGENFIYNPFSIINLFADKLFNNYWFKSGTPTFLTKIIRTKNVPIYKFESSFEVKSGVFDSYDLENIDINILLFQAGYLTIKEKIINPEDFSLSYKLAYPNKEVRDSFYDQLVGEYTGIDKTDIFEITQNLKNLLEEKEIDKFFTHLQTIYSKIPAPIFIKENESYYHTVIYLILKLLKADIITAESYSNHGRVDAIISTNNFIYVVEFKMSSVTDALNQIKNKQYYQPYLSDERELLCIGVAFSKEKRNIEEYKIVTVDQLLKM